MPTMCRSPVHSAANAATLCDSCKSQPCAAGVLETSSVAFRFEIWNLRFLWALELGIWDLGFPGPRPEFSRSFQTSHACVFTAQHRLQNGPGDCLPFA